MTKKFLVVDDDPLQRKSYKIALEEFIHGNVEVLEADNIQDAFELIKQNDFAMVVLDNQLPGDKGFRLLYDLHQEKIRTHVLFMSAAMPDDLSRNAEALGAVACVEKCDMTPIDVAKMIEGIINEDTKPV